MSQLEPTRDNIPIRFQTLFKRITDLIPEPIDSRRFETSLGEIEIVRNPKYFMISIDGKIAAKVGSKWQEIAEGQRLTLGDILDAAEGSLLIEDIESILDANKGKKIVILEIADVCLEITRHVPEGKSAEEYLIIVSPISGSSSWVVALDNKGGLVAGDRHRREYLRELIAVQTLALEPNGPEGDSPRTEDYLRNVVFSRNRVVGEVIVYRARIGLQQGVYFKLTFPEPVSVEFDDFSDSEIDREAVEESMHNWIVAAERRCNEIGIPILERMEPGMVRSAVTVNNKV